MESLGFIEDKFLRERIENAFEYSVALLNILLEKDDTHEIFKEETRRVIILYIISCIEAIFLYAYKTKKDKIEIVDYKHIHFLPEKFKYAENKDQSIIVAVQVKGEKSHIGLYDLIKFFEIKKIIKSEIVKDLLNLNDMRNTHHLGKDRVKSCSVDDVELAFKLLYFTLDKMPKLLKNK